MTNKASSRSSILGSYSATGLKFYSYGFYNCPDISYLAAILFHESHFEWTI